MMGFWQKIVRIALCITDSNEGCEIKKEGHKFAQVTMKEWRSEICIRERNVKCGAIIEIVSHLEDTGNRK